MKWQVGRRSGNVEDRRGQGMGGAAMGGLGIGGVLIVAVIAMLMGKDPSEVLSQVTEQSGSAQTQANAAPVDDQASQFVGAVLGSTEDVWSKTFQQSGSTYPAPKLVMFSGAVASACGRASSAVGPFYCPSDQKVYLDTSFFQDMKARLGAGGDFAEAYVIAHEVGHHVQTLTGVAAKVNSLRARGGNVEGDNGVMVRMELQADCYAGVWANRSQQQNQWMEAGDIEEALTTASAIGDDRLQKQSQGTVVPDSFTHGTSEQRVRWFRNGFDGGEVGRCDTFNARQL